MNKRTNNSEGMGRDAAERFIKMAKDRGFDVTLANSQQDRLEHWDVCITKPDLGIDTKIEIKSMKRKNRWDNKPQSEWICVELKGITGYPGWLYGKADVMAFEIETGFLLVAREELVEVVEKNIDVTLEPITSPSKGKKLYTSYRRFGQKDKFAFIKKTDIQFLSETKEWKEENAKNN